LAERSNSDRRQSAERTIRHKKSIDRSQIREKQTEEIIREKQSDRKKGA
jgi:hypothetical protein